MDHRSGLDQREDACPQKAAKLDEEQERHWEKM